MFGQKSLVLPRTFARFETLCRSRSAESNGVLERTERGYLLMMLSVVPAMMMAIDTVDRSIVQSNCNLDLNSCVRSIITFQISSLTLQFFYQIVTEREREREGLS